MATYPSSPAANGGGTVKFQTNIPETVSLAFAEGREVTSNYSGDQVMFTLDDGRRMYLAPFVADKIRAAGIRAHEPFQICKREVAQGNRRTVEFQIKPMQGGRSLNHQSPASAAALPGQNNEDLTPALAESIRQAQAAREARQTAAAPAAPAIAAGMPDQLGGILAECGIAAINATHRMETYGETNGIKLQFDAGAIERMAVTLFIEYNRRGSR